MPIDFKKLGKAAAETGADMTKVVTGEGGGDYVPPAEGPCRLRFIGYIETGRHESTFKGEKKTAAKAYALFEVSGPKHPTRTGTDGKVYPCAIAQVKLTVSRHEKATMVKLFNILNHAGAATSFFELLGEPYLGTIRHRKYKYKDGGEGVAIELTNADGVLQIRAPSFPDPETGDLRTVAVDPAITPLAGFMWDVADKEQWDSIFIDGMSEPKKDKDGNVTAPARSKNKWQNEIKRALNYKGSAAFLLSGGVEADDISNDGYDDEGEARAAAPVPADEPTPTGDAADDALAGVA